MVHIESQIILAGVNDLQTVIVDLLFHQVFQKYSTLEVRGAPPPSF